MKKILYFAIIILFSCEKEGEDFPYNTCVIGEVIGYEQCLKATLIQLDDTRYGDSIQYDSEENGLVSYSNVILSPGIYPIGSIYFKARKYNDKDDYDLFLTDPLTPCQWLYAPNDVFTVVITGYSMESCHDIEN